MVKVKLEDWLDELSKNTKGIVVVENYSALRDNIDEYQNQVLHSLSKGIVADNNIQSLIRVTERIHDIRNVQFEDEAVPELLLQIYRGNLETLGNLSEELRTKLEESLVNKAIEEGTPQEKYEAILNNKANKLVEEFEKEETERLDNLAEKDVEAIALGIPIENVKRDLRTRDEKLHDIVMSIRQEQLEKEKQRQHNLSLFEEAGNLREYKERQKQDLEKTLQSVSNCVVRNYGNERLISQGYGTKKKSE